MNSDKSPRVCPVNNESLPEKRLLISSYLHELTEITASIQDGTIPFQKDLPNSTSRFMSL